MHDSMRPGSGIVSSGGDLSLASLPGQYYVTYKAAMGPAGVVEPIYGLRKEMLMNCTHPSLQPSIIDLSINSSDSHMRVHPPAYLWGWACRPKVLSGPQGSEQHSLHRRWRCRTGWLHLCCKRQKHCFSITSSTPNKPVRQRFLKKSCTFSFGLSQLPSAKGKQWKRRPFFGSRHDDSDDDVM